MRSNLLMRIVVAIVAGVGLVAPDASASLLGTTVGVSVTGDALDGVLLIDQGGSLSTSASVVVGAGHEFDLIPEPDIIAVEDLHRVDIADYTITFDALDGNGYDDGASISFTGLDWGGTGSLASATIVLGGLFFGPEPALVGFSPGDTSLTINLEDVGSSSSFHDFQVVLTPTPEPSSLALLGLGLGLLARRRSAQRVLTGR